MDRGDLRYESGPQAAPSKFMTIQSERINAITWAREFLVRVSCSYGGFKGIPLEVRKQARAVLRHYPSKSEFNLYFKSKHGVA